MLKFFRVIWAHLFDRHVCAVCLRTRFCPFEVPRSGDSKIFICEPCYSEIKQRIERSVLDVLEKARSERASDCP